MRIRLPCVFGHPLIDTNEESCPYIYQEGMNWEWYCAYCPLCPEGIEEFHEPKYLLDDFYDSYWEEIKRKVFGGI